MALFDGASGSSGGHGGNYKKYMDQSADWHGYMDKYAGDYKDKFASDYAGDFEKDYKNKYAGDYETSYKGKFASGNWREYMKKYAGDYQGKYSGDFDKYMSQGEGKQSGHWQTYVKDTDDYVGTYKDYMHGSGTRKGADYQKYVDGHAGNFKQYMDHGETLKLAPQPAPLTLFAAEGEANNTGAGQSVDWRSYVRKYAGIDVPENTSDKQAWKDAFIDRYAQAYRHYIIAGEKLESQFPDAKRDASKCNTLDELKEWHHAQKARIDDFVPKEYQGYATGHVDEEYKLNKERIQDAVQPDSSALAPWSAFSFSADEPPASDASDAEWREHYMRRYAAAYMPYAVAGNSFAARLRAEDCHTVAELKTWRRGEQQAIDTYVPRSYRAFAAGSVEQKYEDNKARIIKEDPSQAEDDDSAPAEFSVWATSSEALSGEANISLQPIVVVLAVLPIVMAMVAVVYRSSTRADNDYTEGLLPPTASAV